MLGVLISIFHDQHKTLYNVHVFSPDPAVSHVADKEVAHREKYTLCSICCILFIEESVISFLAMNAFTWDT